MDDKLQINASLFYYDYKGQQVDAVFGSRSLTALGSLNGKIQGGEVEMEYRPTTRLQLGLSGGYLNSKYNDDQTLSGIQVGGNKFPFAPTDSYVASFDYDAFYVANGKIVLHGDDSYTGHYFYDPFGSRQATGVMARGSGDYSLVSGRLSYVAQKYSVSAWVKNLTDKVYYPYALNLEAGYGIDMLIRGVPRTFGLEATFHF